MPESLISVSYDHDEARGILAVSASGPVAVWDRLKQSVVSVTEDHRITERRIDISWQVCLDLIREYAPQQKRLEFQFRPDSTAKSAIEAFVQQYKQVQQARSTLSLSSTTQEIEGRLEALGFTRRKLREFQLRDLQRLLSLQNGANFSVPGAGKTTVTFALHLLTSTPDIRLVVVAPKTAFPAWREVIADCMSNDADEVVREPFCVLSGGSDSIRSLLQSNAKRFLITYDQLITTSDVVRAFLLRHKVHLVLDESHRMKGGLSVRRGIVLLNLATFPIRRDILSGTPMPQAASDLQSQLDFLWPGVGLGLQIVHGRAPRDVLGNLYVRTTKTDLGLPPVYRHFIQVGMGRGQAALYAVVRSETLRNLSSLRAGGTVDIVRARGCVMRLLQLSTNPKLALTAMASGSELIESGIAQQVLDDGPSPKMLAVRDFARRLAEQGRKSVIWTIFTGTIVDMERMLADLNPVTIDGGVPTGDTTDPDSREGRLRIFHEDESCKVLLANPAAAGEGISLHHACHDAIYLDRSYNSTHYLQSIDRVHRLGLPPDVDTHVHIFQTAAPQGLGCVDHSVSRRLAIKLRALQQLLDDEDLHRIALDEELSDAPIDYDIRPEDLVDLIDELEGRSRTVDSELA